MIRIVYFPTLIALVIYSFGFIDPNLFLSQNPMFLQLQKPLSILIFQMRPLSAILFSILLAILFYCYIVFLQRSEKLFLSSKQLFILLISIAVLLALSFPALTYDLFNYMTTAKVTFYYHENPYIVMPTDIPNEPYLAFTRAANKVALYGPVWILLTAIPHYIGGGSIWQTIVAFKLLNAAAYILLSFLIFRITKSVRNVVFFALNPLVLIEVLVSGHNDIHMMLLAIGGLFLWQRKRISEKAIGIILFMCSWFIKGATIILLPLIFLKKLPWDRLLFTAYCLLSLVFFVAAPLREELYPWYAVWLISIASCMDFKKQKFIIGFSIILSFALELRHLPYMWMGYYEGPGPILRFLLTVIPILGFLVFTGLRKIKIRNN